MVSEKRLIDPTEYASFLKRYIKELHEVDAPMIAGAVERCLYKLEEQPTVEAIVLPLNIGDMVYAVVQCEDGPAIYKIKVGHISVSLSDIDTFPPYAVGKVMPDGGGFTFDLAEIGQTVFLTKEAVKMAFAEILSQNSRRN